MPLPTKGRPARAALLVVAATAGIGVLVALNLLVFTRDPSQSYPLFLIVIGLAGRWISARFGYAAVAVSALALAYFNLEGEGFAVSNPHDAVGLINLITAGLLVVFVIDRMAAHAEAAERARRDAEAGAAGQAALRTEISHRVVNDLASLGALATLRANAATTDETRQALGAMADRMRFLGAVYRRLNVTGGAATDARSFLAGLCDDLRHAHLGVRPISIELTAPPALFAFSQLALMGLVLNESVTNALKYAFPDDRAGTIRASLAKEPDADGWRLLVSDDGVGPDGGGPKGTGLGLKLIRSIAAQLHGSYELRREDGRTVSCLRFVADGIPNAAAE